MNLSPTPEQRALQAEARKLLAKEVTRERLLAWERTPEGYDAGFWRAISGLGWLGLSLPEAAGGGDSLLDAALLMEECGRGLAPAAIHAAVVGARALARLGASADELAPLVRGERQATVASLERDGRELVDATTRIDRGLLIGEKWYVRQGVTAELLVVAARDGAAPGLFLVRSDAPAVSRRELRTFGGDRQSVFRFDGVRPERCLARDGAAVEALARIRDEATALALAEIVGGFSAVVEMTVAYVKERVQFGQPLGKFQGVQFRCADMATSLAATRHVAFRAIWRLTTGLDAAEALAAARAWCGGAYKQATLDAHQLHGGAGYVVEHPLRRYAERAQSHAILFVAEEDGLAALADRILGPVES